MTHPLSPPTGRAGAAFCVALAAVLFAFGVFFDRLSLIAAERPEAAGAQHAQLQRDLASPDVQRIAQWALETKDHAGLPFFVVDKTKARLFAFDAQGHLKGSASVLLGSRLGDEPIVPATPAGRFASDTWRSALEDGIVWVSGPTALTLHRLSSASAPGRAKQRIESGAVEDKRISDGSLHVEDEFYADYLAPLRGHGSVVYVLPESRPMRELFAQAGALSNDVQQYQQHDGDKRNAE